MHISEPVSILIKSLSITDNFESGVVKLASFFRNTEEKWNPAKIISEFFTVAESKLIEYCLYLFLDITRSDINLLNVAVRFKNLHRLMVRYSLYYNSLSGNEAKIVSDLKEKLPVKKPHDIMISEKVSRKWSKSLSDGDEIGSNSRKQFAILLRSESRSLRARLDWLSENVDSYDMKSISKLLPYLTAGEEYAKDLDDLSYIIEKGDPFGLPVCNFELHMKEDGFKKWMKKIDSDSDLTLFSKIIQQQRQRLVPVRNLIAACSIIRALNNSSMRPFQWIQAALSCTTRDGFTIDAGNDIGKVYPLIRNSAVKVEGTCLKGNFSESSFTQLIGNNLLSLQTGTQREPTVREIVIRCMQNDILIIGLLSDPRVFNKPGIVEQIAKSSRSLSVLQKIASTRELYTGQANTGVALALLKNPTNIPISLLRAFINSRYISLSEMRSLVNNRYNIRREVYGEIQRYLDRKR
ncbi:MAG TPA: hypothetical protein VKY57_06500 [Chitinispirillaceae bacterium]|nr:hypothetical protein [Chitinispirillaceae bacterium]